MHSLLRRHIANYRRIVGLFALASVIIYLPLTMHTEPQGASTEAPYPPSPVITDLTWAPASTIQRAAQGSDNFPVTWADDDSLYTAYGDGFGFDKAAPTKLSLGFAKVTGEPADFSGVNIPSPDRQIGQGAVGKKASGMLMVDGVLYMWVRNANNNGEECQLARSTDHAVNWTWSDWTFADFGYCTFINFGQNYAGARDNYVYMVTHDLPSAYDGTEYFVLTRVPKDQIFERAAYEFFVSRNDNGEALWTSDINARGTVFSHPENHARRSGMTYNAALGRYLWWQGIPHGGDERYEGGFGVYDAPEPWGPWTTVYYTEAWDVGPGETGSFPTKWMSADGREIHLVFSGDDAFSVRKATLTVAEPADASIITPTATVPTPTVPTASPSATATATTTPAVRSATCGSDSYFVEQDGSVVIEAEQYTALAAATGLAVRKTWQPVVEPAGYGGNAAMQALPNTQFNTGRRTHGPALLYTVDFQTPGDYFVHVRGIAPGPRAASNDSLHVGLNGVAVTAQRGTGLTGFQRQDAYSWQNTANSGEPLRIHVAEPGRHTVYVWMREDGVIVDRIWLTTQPDAVAQDNTEIGPVASACVSAGVPSGATSGDAAPFTETQRLMDVVTSTLSTIVASPLDASIATPTATPISGAESPLASD